MSSYRSNSAPERTPYVSSSSDYRQGRTIFRADVASFAYTGMTDSEYRRRSRERYPPKGLAGIPRGKGRTPYVPQHPKHIADEYDQFKDAIKMRDKYDDDYKVELVSRQSFEQSRGISAMYNPEHTHKPFRKTPTSGVYMPESHAKLHTIASRQEQAAYVGAAGRTEHYRKYPLTSIDVRRDKGHHKAQDFEWTAYEEADARERDHRQHRTPYRRYS